MQWIYPPDNFTITECKKILLQMPLLYVFWSQNGWKGHSTLSNSYSSNRTPEFSTPFLIFISLAWFVFVICNLPLKHSVPHSRSQSFDPFDQRRGLIPDAGQNDRSSGNKNESSQGFSSAHSWNKNQSLVSERKGRRGEVRRYWGRGGGGEYYGYLILFISRIRCKS